MKGLTQVIDILIKYANIYFIDNTVETSTQVGSHKNPYGF